MLVFLDSLNCFHSLDFLCTQTLTEDFIMNSELFVFFPFLLSSLLLFLLSGYSKVKSYRSTTVIAVDYIASSQYRIHSISSITASSRAKEFFPLLTSLLLYVYSTHLESSVAIYSVLQGVLFVETAESHQRNFWNITDCKIILESLELHDR